MALKRENINFFFILVKLKSSFKYEQIKEHSYIFKRYFQFSCENQLYNDTTNSQKSKCKSFKSSEFTLGIKFES